ncbi:MAG TPA: hypothetical protein VN369_06325 [Terriglobales bacterium]|nr:hypothetical protein [Terriglobales bacterium]
MIKKRLICLLLGAALALPAAAAAAPLEFSQVPDIVAAGNRQIAMNALTLAVLQSNGTVADAQNSIYQLSGGLSSLAANLLESGDAIGVAAGNGLSLTAQYIAAQAKSIDIARSDIEIYKLRFAQADQKIQNAAQSLLPMLARLELGAAAADRAEPMLADALAAKEVAVSRGLASASELLAAKLDAATLKTTKAQLAAKRQALVMQLNSLLGRSYDEELTLAPLPEPDTACMDDVDLAADIEKAKAACFDIAILRKEYSAVKTKNAEGDEIPSAVKQRQAKRLEIEETEQRLAMRMTQLALDIAAARENLTALDLSSQLAAERSRQAAAKYAVGRLSRLEANAIAEAANTAEDAVQSAKIELFWMIETYKWAVKGLMPEA